MAKKRLAEPKIILPEDIDPRYNWDRPIQAPGQMQVDFEERVDFRRLHRYRLARVRQALSGSDLGALLCFDQHPIRYTTSPVTGEGARDKLTRSSLLTGNGEPWVWDFGSAAKHHRYCTPPGCARTTARPACWACGAAVHTDAGLFRDAAREIKAILDEEGVGDMPVGVDVIELPMMFRIAEGRRQRARRPAGHARCARVQEHGRDHPAQYRGLDGRRHLPGHLRGAQSRASAKTRSWRWPTKRLYEMGSDCVEAINSISGERCCPHPHNFTDRLIRPGDQAFFDIIHSFMGYRTCYYRTFNVGRASSPQVTAYEKAREWMDRAIALIKPGVSSDKIALAFPTAQEIGFSTEMEAFGLNFCHGLGLGLHERPIISRLTSIQAPMELTAGMVFAVETYCPATDGISAARIEEEVVVTPRGAQIITLFPAEKLPIANRY